MFLLQKDSIVDASKDCPSKKKEYHQHKTNSWSHLEAFFTGFVCGSSRFPEELKLLCACVSVSTGKRLRTRRPIVAEDLTVCKCSSQ